MATVDQPNNYSTALGKKFINKFINPYIHI